ncbi:unnamed protein product [Amoebophrya sp. A25]|nr:unnamed protein product [Amoebophrya sp. A25]|eukprot:GSA25T00024062001.1
MSSFQSPRTTQAEDSANATWWRTLFPPLYNTDLAKRAVTSLTIYRILGKKRIEYDVLGLVPLSLRERKLLTEVEGDIYLLLHYGFELWKWKMITEIRNGTKLELPQEEQEEK